MPTETQRIGGLRDIASRFGGMLIDQFGVIHDGQSLYPGTLRVLSELKSLGIPVAVMTNSGKRAEANRQRLVRMGVPRDHFVDAISSGEVAHASLTVKRAFLIGKDGKVARVWRKVKVPGHAKEVLEAARALG